MRRWIARRRERRRASGGARFPLIRRVGCFVAAAIAAKMAWESLSGLAGTIAVWEAAWLAALAVAFAFLAWRFTRNGGGASGEGRVANEE